MRPSPSALLWLLAIACDTRADVQPAMRATGELPPELADISGILDKPVGNCAKFAPGSWTYIVMLRDGLYQALVTKLANSEQRVISLTVLDGSVPLRGRIQQGFVQFDSQTVFWFDPRDYADEARVIWRSAEGDSVDYPPPALDDAKREWNTARGQLLVQLARKAQASCDTVSVNAH